ncbi:MAG: DUF4402 domain-containing protein [Pseudomonadota bacterium]
MKQNVLLITLAAGFAAPPAAHAETADATAGAEIVAPLTVMAWEELFFGTIAPSTLTSGDVFVDVDGTRVCSNGPTCLADNQQAARFAVNGQTGKAYGISVTSGTTVSNGAGDTMAVTGLVSDISTGILVGGSDEFWVGGTLQVSVNQATGMYLGNYTVSVEYQ